MTPLETLLTIDREVSGLCRNDLTCSVLDDRLPMPELGDATKPVKEESIAANSRMVLCLRVDTSIVHSPYGSGRNFRGSWVSD